MFVAFARFSVPKDHFAQEVYVLADLLLPSFAEVAVQIRGFLVDDHFGRVGTQPLFENGYGNKVEPIAESGEQLQ